jgi:pimeloyl-ACP methyl ester carboxylesterase
MPEIELTAGTIEYEDTGGDGPVLVLLGGLVMDGSVWDPLVADLRLVISSCEAFENYPPGLPGKNVRLTAFVPGGIFLTMQALRIRALRRLPIAFGWMAKHRLPDARLVEVADSYTLIMRDQPQAFARAIREFVRETAEATAPV